MPINVTGFQEIDPSASRERQVRDVRDAAVVASAAPDARQERRDDRVAPVAEVSRGALESTLEQTREIVFGDRRLNFEYNRDIDRIIVRVQRGDDGEVVRQIPPEEYLAFIERLQDSVGVLVDEEA